MGLLLILSMGIHFGVSSAQEHQSLRSFSELFETLHTRMLEEELLVTIILHAPLADSGENYITIGYGYDDINITIQEIGSNFFCIREVRGGAELITCIPFSNIAGVTYVNN